MPQAQQPASMPREWYEQLHELAYGRPVGQESTEAATGSSEQSNAGKWTAAAVLTRFMPAFRI